MSLKRGPVMTQHKGLNTRGTHYQVYQEWDVGSQIWILNLNSVNFIFEISCHSHSSPVTFCMPNCPLWTVRDVYAASVAALAKTRNLGDWGIRHRWAVLSCLYIPDEEMGDGSCHRAWFDVLVNIATTCKSWFKKLETLSCTALHWVQNYHWGFLFN